MTGKLRIDTITGHLTGPAVITYNEPWPCRNGSWGSGAMSGALMHTTVSETPSAVAWFNNPQAQASAHFVIAESGAITQMGPVGKGWIAWHAAGANSTWYGIEHADNGNPANPLTPQQITASAQIVECLSAFAGFPLQISDSPSTRGFGWHGMGGAAWGAHPDCPGDVRKAQRSQIIALAMSIRQGGSLTAQPVPAREWITAGMSSLAALALQEHCTPAEILALTASHGPLPADVATYVNGVFAGTISPAAAMPKGLALYLPG